MPTAAALSPQPPSSSLKRSCANQLTIGCSFPAETWADASRGVLVTCKGCLAVHHTSPAEPGYAPWGDDGPAHASATDRRLDVRQHTPARRHNPAAVPCLPCLV